MSRSGRSWDGSREQGCVDLAGEVALEAADHLPASLALLEPAGHVGLGAGVVAQPHHHDAVQGGVGLAVAAAVEPVADGLAGAGLTGEAPHRAAKPASWRRRVGLSPAATSSAPAESVP